MTGPVSSSNGSDPFQEIDTLAARLRENVLTQPQAARLEQLVAVDSTLAQRFLDQMTLTSLLQWEHGMIVWYAVSGERSQAKLKKRPIRTPSLASLEDLKPLVDDGFLSTTDCNSLPSNPWLNTSPKRHSSRKGGAFDSLPAMRALIVDCLRAAQVFLANPAKLTLAAITTIVLLAIGIPLRSYWLGSNSSDERTTAIDTCLPVRVARITKIKDVEWSDGSSPWVESSPIHSGEELKLASGLIELEFCSGATLLVQGPGQFRVESSNSGALSEGRAVAVVPAAAKGFTVQTPAMSIVDLGTEFGVEVDRQGKAEVHVLRGLVEVSAVQHVDSAPSLLLKAGDAVCALAGQVELTQIRVDRERFERVAPRLAIASLKVLAQYRLGENDDPTQPLLTFPSVSKLPLHAARPVRYVLDGAPGVSTRAVALDGNANDFFESDSSFSRLPGDWVLEAWVRPRTTKNGIIVFNGCSGSDGFGLLLSDGRWVGAWGDDNFLIEKQSTCTPGKWTHLALVRQQDQGATLWIDGIRANVRFAERIVAPEMDSFCIGGCSTLPAYSFDGDLDEVRWSQLTQPFEPSTLLLKPKD